MTAVDQALLRFRFAMRMRRELGRPTPAEALAEQRASTLARGRIPFEMIERLQRAGLIEAGPPFRLTEHGIRRIASLTACGCPPDAIHTVHHVHGAPDAPLSEAGHAVAASHRSTQRRRLR